MEKKNFATEAIHSDGIAHKWPGNPVVCGISLSTTFKQETPGKPDVQFSTHRSMSTPDLGIPQEQPLKAPSLK